MFSIFKNNIFKDFKNKNWITNHLILSALFSLIIALFIVKKMLILLPFIGIILLLAILFLPLKWIMFFYVMLATAIQVGTPETIIRFGGLGTNPIEIVMGIALAVFLIEWLSKKITFPSSTLFLAILPFVFYCNVIALFIGLENYMYTRFVNVDLHFAFVWFSVFIFFSCIKDIEDIKKFVKATFIGIFILSLQVFLVFVSESLTTLSMSGKGRVGVQNIGFCVLWFPAMLQYFSITKKTKERILIIICLGITSITLIITQYRDAWAGLVMSLFILFAINLFLLPKGKRGKFILKGLLFIFGGTLLAIILLKLFLAPQFEFLLTFWKKRIFSFQFLQYDPALLARKVTVYESKILFPRHPIFGAGLGSAWHSLGYPTSHLDNLYWYSLVKFGIVGTILFLTPFIIWGYQLFRILKNIRKIKDPLIFSIFMGLISFYPPFFIMHYYMAHLLIAPSMIAITIGLMAITQIIYNKIKNNEEI